MQCETLIYYKELIATCSGILCHSLLPYYLCVQLTDQVQRINTKLQDSLTTLSQASPSAGPAAAAANGNSSSAGAAGDADATAPREKIDKMSAEVVDSNPYSRLMALQRMGIVQDYEKIRQKTVSGAC